MHSVLPLGNRTSLSLSTHWGHASGQRFLGYVLCMKSLVRPSQRFWGIREHAHFLSGNIGKYFKVTRLILGIREHANFENCFQGTRKYDQLFLGNMVPPGKAYLVGLLCTHLGSA